MPNAIEMTKTMRALNSQAELALADSLVNNLPVKATHNVIMAVDNVIICFAKSAAKS